MDAASAYVFFPAAPEDAEESEDEEMLDHGLEALATPAAAAAAAPAGFGTTTTTATAAASAAFAAAPAVAAAGRAGKNRTKHKKKYRQAVDTNIVSVDLGSLANGAAEATGDACFCPKCNAAFSKFSKLTKASAATAAADADATGAAAGAGAGNAAGAGNDDEDSQQWQCEFCGAVNEVDLEPEEIPSVDTLDYIVAAPAAAAAVTTGAGGGAGATTGTAGGAAARPSGPPTIVFAIDVSGSMCVTTEVPGNVALKGASSRRGFDGLRAAGDSHDQRLPGQRRNVTYVSRLQAVQASVVERINALKKSHPEYRVVLVTFSADVTIVGDGVSDATTLAGSRLDDFEQLKAAGAAYKVASPVSASGDTLTAKVQALEEGGGTALGPALLVSIALASQQRGSRVVMCTDGLANIGLGALDEELEATAAPAAEESAAESAAGKYYARLGQLAKEAGVMVDVVGIEGEGCDVETLCGTVEPSGGSIVKVKPLDVTRSFAAMLETPPVATAVTATFFLHAGLTFRNVRDEDTQVHRVAVRRELGMAVPGSTTTFEYGIHPDSFKPGSQLSKLKHLPFQVQIAYTKLDGTRCVRVISRQLELTRDRSQAEQCINTPVVATHVAQTCANLARRGSYERSRANAYMFGKLMHRTCRTEEDTRTVGAWHSAMHGLEANLQAVAQEEAKDGSAISHSYDDSTHDSASRAKRKTRRRKADKLSSMLSTMRNVSYQQQQQQQQQTRSVPAAPAPRHAAAAAAAPPRSRAAGIKKWFSSRMSAAPE